MKHLVLVTKESEGYALLQAGDGEKLERFGAYVLHRPDPQALFFADGSTPRMEG